MFLHVPYHWWTPDNGEGFADEILQVAGLPKTSGDVLALKTMIGSRNHLDPELITLFAWTVLGE
mgnify:CR=1